MVARHHTRTNLDQQLLPRALRVCFGVFQHWDSWVDGPGFGHVPDHESPSGPAGVPSCGKGFQTGSAGRLRTWFQGHVVTGCGWAKGC